MAQNNRGSRKSRTKTNTKCFRSCLERGSFALEFDWNVVLDAHASVVVLSSTRVAIFAMMQRKSTSKCKTTKQLADLRSVDGNNITNLMLRWHSWSHYRKCCFWSLDICSKQPLLARPKQAFDSIVSGPSIGRTLQGNGRPWQGWWRPWKADKAGSNGRKFPWKPAHSERHTARNETAPSWQWTNAK